MSANLVGDFARDVGLDQLDDWQARLIDDPTPASPLLLWPASR